MTVPFALQKIDHVVLLVRDPEASAAFYARVVGAAEERRVESVGMIQLRAGASLIDLLPASAAPFKSRRNMDHFCLRVDPWDVETIKAHLDAESVKIIEEGTRYGAEGMGPSIYFRDPDGNTVELKGPSESAPENA